MAQEIQKPTENKDFDFILNQNPDSQPVKKGVDKKVIAIFVLIVVTLLVMGISFFVGSNKKVQKSNQSNIAQHPDKTQQEKASDVIDTFFNYVKVQKYREAYSLFGDTLPISEQSFLKDTAPFLTRLSLKECQALENSEATTNDAGMLVVTYSCSLENSEDYIGFKFIMNEITDGSYEIVFYNLVNVDEN